MVRDLLFALRQLRRSPGFAAAAILTLALGIGSNTAIYQVLDAVAFRSLPVHDPEHLVRVEIRENGKPLHMSYPLYREIAARQQVALGMFAASDYPLHAAVLRGRGDARTVNAVLVTGSYFPVLGVSARLGRVFTEADDQAAAPPVAVISDAFWEREFARRTDVLGQSLEINRAVVTIAGVAPPGFYGETQGNAPDAWLPISVAAQAMATDWLNAPKSLWLTAMARLRPGVTAAQAQAAFDALYRQVPAAERRVGAEYRVVVEPGSRGVAELQQRFENPLLVLMGVVGMVLLIACCNLANLLLGRAAARSHEIGVRLALGAGRGRLLRQSLCESLVLAAIGAALAIALANWGAMALVNLGAEGQNWRIPLDSGWRVLAFTAGVTAAATCFFGLAPAWSASRVDLQTALQAGSRSQSGSRHRQWIGKALAVVQISISLVLLAGSALLVRSLWSLRHQDFGFRGDNLLMVELPWEFNPAMMARYKAMSQPLYDRINHLPGVLSGAFSCFGPMGGDQHTGPLSSPERPARREDQTRIVHVSPHYFETMGIRLVAGRGITAEDAAGGPAVAVLSETAAQKIFGGANAVGRRVAMADRFDAQHAVEVVGVAHDVRFANPADPFGFLVYVPMSQSPAPITAVMVRTVGDPALVAGVVQSALHAVDPAIAIGAVRPLEQTIDAKLSHERLLALLATSFGLLALALTSVGVYGVISYGVQRRVREIGIRLALGATRGQVSGTLMKEVALLVSGSAALGAVGAILATRALRSMIFAFGPSDYSLLAGVTLFLIAVALLAGFLPTRRASRSDPMDALRDS